MHYTERTLSYHFKKLVQLIRTFVLKFLFNLCVKVVKYSIENFFLKVIRAHELGSEPEISHILALFLILMLLKSTVVSFTIKSPSLRGITAIIKTLASPR